MEIQRFGDGEVFWSSPSWVTQSWRGLELEQSRSSQTIEPEIMALNYLTRQLITLPTYDELVKKDTWGLPRDSDSQLVWDRN